MHSAERTLDASALPKRTIVSLAHPLAADADAAQIAEAVVATWQEMDAALTPIIGQRGVAALYKRSRHLTSSLYPWLTGLHEGARAAIDLAALEAAIARQSSADAAAGGDALLRTFHELLSSLVGPSLTERLLRSAWADSLSGPPAKDTTP